MNGDYSHRQFGRGFVAMIAAMMFFLATITLLSGVFMIALIALAVSAVLVLLFHSLRVEVDRDALRLSYGIGVVRKRFDLTSLRDAYAVRNKWWYGLGIRLTPHGWLYNVSGLDAVEIVRTSGKKFRVGTDEPQALVTALKAALKDSKSGGSRQR